MAKIQKTTDAERQEIMRRSVLSLADRPSEYGQKPVDIKRAQTAPIFGSDHSVLHELDRVVDAINNLLNGSTESEATISTIAQTIVGAINELRGKIAESGEYLSLATNAQDLQGAVNELWGICDVMEAILNTASSEGNAENLVKRDENGRFEAATAISDSSDGNYSEYFVANVKFVKDAVSALAGVVGTPTSENVGDAVVRRDANGKFKAGTPDGSDADEVATVGYISGAYGPTKSAVTNATSDKTENTLMKRNASGRAKIAAPSGSDNDEIANVGYIGKKTDLETTSKDTVVGAVNELKGRIDTSESAISGVQSALAGYSRAYICDDFDDIVDALAGNETLKDSSGASRGLADLKTGDMIYLKDTNAPDFWWQENADASAERAESYDDVDLYVSGVGYLHKVEIDDSELQGYTEDAQAWAEGKRGASPVTSGDETYHNNAKYWAGEAEDAASTASDAASDASDSADSAFESANDAADSETNASGSASAASNSATQASNHAKTAEAYALGTKGGEAVGSDDPAYQNNAKYYAEIVAPAEAEAVLASKANIDGFYEGMTVGHTIETKAIASDREIEDADEACPPITFGAVGGSAEVQDGYSAFKELRGNTVCWNQLIPTDLFPSKTSSEVIFTNNEDGTITVNGTANGYAYNSVSFAFKEGHKYLLVGTPTGGSSSTYGMTVNNPIVYEEGSGLIFTATASSATLYIFVQTGVTVNNIVFKPQIFDLTQLTVDYSTVAAFRQDYPVPYYVYNAGQLLSSKSASMILRGRNQLTLNRTAGTLSGWANTTPRAFEEGKYYAGLTADGYYDSGRVSHVAITENSVSFSTSTNGYGIGFPVSVIPGQDYIAEVDDYLVGIGWYDKEGHYLSYSSAVPPSNIAIGTAPTNAYWGVVVLRPVAGETVYTYTGIQFRLYYDTPNLPYVPYEEQVVTLPNIELRSVGSVYDVAYQEGGGKRRIGSEDLGTLNWSLSTGYGYANLTNPKRGTRNTLTTPFPSTITGYQINNNNDALVVYFADGTYASASELKAAMSGVILYYELAEETDIPVSENAGWQEFVKIDNYGTIEFTVDPDSHRRRNVPQAYFIRYTVNLVEFLDTAYVRCEGNANNIARASDVEVVGNRVPALSSSAADGTYTLKATKSGTTITYFWLQEV